MHDSSDMDLLREYARQNSEAAFAELVRRHIALVYSAALRHVGSAGHAEEITQAVFIILARKAAGLRPDTILPGWQGETTRLTALSFLRGERRRQFREQEAYMQSTLQESNETAAWHQLAPLLDEALARLGKKERDAVVLRFFKDQNLREVAAALNINEPAAQRRVHRAVEKLRQFFMKRGITLASGTITGAISTNAMQVAPVGLAKSVTLVAMTKGVAASGSTLTLIKGALKIMAWMKMKTAVVAGVVVLLAAGTTTTFVVQHKHKLHGGQPQLRSGPPQLHIKARFFEIPKGSDDFLNSFSGILDANSAKTLLQTIESKRGAETLGEPEVTTSSGRQTQMRATKIISVVTGFEFNETNSAGSISPQTEKVDTGPIFDVVPVVLSNGQIQMTITALNIEFIGYADPANLPPDYATNSAGQKIRLPITLPAFQIKQAMTKTTLADGQSLLLIVPKVKQPSLPDAKREARVAQLIADAEKKDGEKTTLVLVTSDIVDAAGNLIRTNTQ